MRSQLSWGCIKVLAFVGQTHLLCLQAPQANATFITRPHDLGERKLQAACIKLSEWRFVEKIHAGKKKKMLLQKRLKPSPEVSATVLVDEAHSLPLRRPY